MTRVCVVQECLEQLVLLKSLGPMTPSAEEAEALTSAAEAPETPSEAEAPEVQEGAYSYKPVQEIF